MLKKLLLILFFLPFILVAHAQQSITGVINNDNGNPIANAKVQIQNTKINTFS